MKIKVLSRNPDDFLRETKRDIHKCKFLFYCARFSRNGVLFAFIELLV